MRRISTDLYKNARYSCQNQQNATNIVSLRQLRALYLTSKIQDPWQWTQLIRCYLSQGFPKEAALLAYTRRPPSRTHQSILPLILKACSSVSFLPLGKSLHAESAKVGISHGLLVGITLVSMCCNCGRLDDARKMFDEMPERNVVAYDAMVGGYSMAGDMDSALRLFVQMPLRTPVTWATMIKGFAEKGDTEKVREFFQADPT